MTAASSPRKTHARALFAAIAPGYDRRAQLLALGQYRRWHGVLVERLAPAASRPGAVVADVATGTGAVALALARRYPCRVLAFDQSPEMVDEARRRIAAESLGSRVEVAVAEAEALPVADAALDGLVHTYLLRYVDDPAATLDALASRLRPGGVMASLDFGVPDGAARAAWWLWTRVGLPAGGVLAGPGWVHTGRFLGPSIERFWREHPLEELLAMWERAGMERLRVQRLSLGGAVVIRGERRA